MAGLKVYRFPYFYPSRYQKLYYEGGVVSMLKRSRLAWVQVPLALASELYHALRVVKKEKVDVVHSHWVIPSGLVGAICKKTLGTRHLLTLHAGGVIALERLPFKRNLANFIVSNTDEITVVSSYVYERLLNLVSTEVAQKVRGKTKVIPMGVNTALFHGEVDPLELKSRYGIESKFALLSIGRIVEKKGFEYAIEAMAKILSQNRDVKLIVCGDGPLLKDLEELTTRLNLRQAVVYAGYVTGTKKIDYFTMSDVLVVPSVVTGSGDTEGMPVVILEGLAAGKPCVATDVGGVRDVIKDGHNGFLIEQRNSAQIAEKVLEMINDDALRLKFSRNALHDGEKYDWKIIGERYARAVRDTVGE